jgi:hypothetical protein
MLKKVILGTLFIGLIAILVIGAIYRTMEKSQDAANSAGHGRGSSDSSVTAIPVDQRQGQGQGQAQVTDWLTLTGVVEQINESTLSIGLASDKPIIVEGRPWRFAQEQGFAARVGDKVSLTGFYDGEVFEVGQLTNATSDQTIYIREDNGRPFWAGGGRSSAVTQSSS